MTVGAGLPADSAEAGDPVIRRALRSDHQQILAMDAGARSLVATQRGGHEWLTEHLPIVDIDIDDLMERTVVAEYAGAVVGFAVHALEHRPGRGVICRVDRIFVEEQARELGCGDQMLALVTEIARRAGCVAIEGNALPGDRETKNLYERAGMKARAIVTAIDL